jgi:EAL domain-containing protein (putative c-di-GMP-specific phosphodiesterase class I)/CheY-like chemotaxis protein
MKGYNMVVDNQTDITAHHYLLISDDSYSTGSITNMLHSLGAYSLDIVDDGAGALRHITKTKKKPDVIICALAIAKMDGVEFLRHLAEELFTGGIILINGKTPRILRIAVDLAEAHQLNVLGSLPKSFTKTEFRNLLSTFKGLKEMPVPLPASLVTPRALRIAIEQDQLSPFFQPKISLETGKVIGAEALARWQHPHRGLIPPMLFIPVAEKNNLISLLTNDIISKTFRQVAEWKKNGSTVPFAINLSAPLLADTTLADSIEKELEANGLNPADLTLEITESSLCNGPACIETLLRFRLKGIKLSLDDFGTGTSTMEQLHKMPLSELKIDRMFVTGAGHDKESRAFFQSAVTLAKRLNLITVAEGVETQEDLDICRELGCDAVQGYFFSRPVPGKKFLDAIQPLDQAA